MKPCFRSKPQSTGLAAFGNSLILLAVLAAIEQSALLNWCFAAEVPVNADTVFPQTIIVNRGDSVRWTKSYGPPDVVIQSHTGEYALILSATNTNSLSATYQFDTAGTNFYKGPFRSGMVIVRDWTNEPPTITINSPVEGNIFNCCGNEREPIPLLATPTVGTTNVNRVEFLSGNAIVATVTNAPYFVRRGNLPLGSHTLVARVIGRTGVTYDSAPVHVTVLEIRAPVLNAQLLRVKDQSFVLVSWIEPATLDVMSRAEIVTQLGSHETSSTSFSGVRFWIERVRPGSNAFFSIRFRF